MNVSKSDYSEVADFEKCSDPKKEPEILNLDEALSETGAPHYRSNLDIEGIVLLDLLVDTTGTIQAVNVINSPHTAFTEHLLNVTEKLKIEPGICANKKAVMWKKFSFEYSFSKEIDFTKFQP